MSQDELRGLSENVGEVKVEADEIRRLTADLEAIVHRLPFRDAALSERLVRGLRQAGFDLADPPATGGWHANDGRLARQRRVADPGVYSRADRAAS